MPTELKQIMQKLDIIKSELDFIKTHMVDIDMILIPEEEKRLNISLEEYKQGKTVSLDKVKKELGL